MLLSIIPVATTSSSAKSIEVVESGESSGDYEYKNLDDGTAEITGYNGSDTEITIPSEIDGHKVTVIGLGAFKNCLRIKSITIPDSVTTIGNNAFYGCKSLISITIPEGVTTIGWYAFESCTSITSITILKGVTTIADYAFRNCENLTNITIPDSVTTIGNYAFLDCKSLTSITIPNSVINIGHEPFYRCYKLSNITVSDNNTSYSSVNGVLFDKDKTKLVCYPAGKTETFYTTPEGVTTIEESAFSYCNLIGITILDGVRSIGKEAFYGCRSLTCITIPSSVAVIGYAAFCYCTRLINITFPNSETIIENSVFYFCESLKSITIPEGVTSIGDDAFFDCKSLTSITIPESVTTIGDRAFYGCYNLIIYGKIGSVAEKYAKENDIKFVDVDNSTVDVISVMLNYTSKILNSGSRFTLKVIVAPSNATNKAVKWTTSNSKIATVTSTGVVTAKAKGTAYIKATAVDGSKKYAQCKVTVKQPVTAVKLNATAKTLNRGSRTVLKATIYPTNANVRTVSWKSFNTRVATVTSKGVVTAKSKGVTYVRATAKDGSRKYAQCKITVKQPVTTVKLNVKAKTLKRGAKLTLKATVSPSNANVRTVSWKSTNTRVATVTSKGVVTAKAKGTAYIRATAKDGSRKYAQCKITVK